MKDDCLVGYKGQNRVLISMDEQLPYASFDIQFEGDEFSFQLHLVDCKELVKRLSLLTQIIEATYIAKEGKNE